MNKKQMLGNIILFTGTLVWGLAFLFQTTASSKISAFTLNAIRCLIGFISLIPCIAIKRKIEHKPFFEEKKEDRIKLLKISIISGLFLCAAINFQQFGIMSYPKNEVATTGRSGFITAMYVILVPLIEVIFLNKKLSLNAAIGVVLALIGTYLLCANFSGNKLYLGDFIMFLCALGFAFQILCVDRFASNFDSLKFNALQFFVCFIISSILMLIFEEPSIDVILECKYEILYLGIVSSGIGYSCQIIGQKLSKNPTAASIIMSFESVFALLFGLIFLKEILSIKEIIGCTIMFIAIIISQLNFKKETN